MTPKLVYVADPYCSWCYAMKPVVARLAAGEGTGIPLAVQSISGGMVPEDKRFASVLQRLGDAVALHERVSAASGVQFGAPYIAKLRDPDAPDMMNSLQPARAEKALLMLGAGDPLEVAGAVQDLWFEQGRDLTDPASYRPLCERYGIDFQAFAEKFASDEVSYAVRGDLDWVRAAGIQGFPALLLQDGERHYQLLARGFTPYEDAAPRLAAALRDIAAAGDGAGEGETCAADGSGC